MLAGNVVLTENAGAARVHRTPGETARLLYRKPTPEEVAERRVWRKRAEEENRRLNEIEPLPDNFEAICEGRETVPLYSR
jgi:hypothetical protein